MTESDTPTRSVAVLLYAGCTIAEVVETATRLRHAGCNVQWVSPNGELVVDDSGLRLDPGRAISELTPASIDAVVVPGGDPGSVIGVNAVRELLTAAASHGAVVAGICGGVLLLADAGLLTGRTVTHNYRAPWAPPEIEEHVHALFEGCVVEADPSVGVVVDGGIVTALPNATIEFALTVCEQLGVLDPQTSAVLTRHLRGDFVPELFGEVT